MWAYSGLEEAQAGIKIARRNINNLRYTDDTTLMAESEEVGLQVRDKCSMYMFWSRTNWIQRLGKNKLQPWLTGLSL